MGVEFVQLVPPYLSCWSVPGAIMSVGFTVIGFANEGLRAVFSVVFPLVLAYSRGVHPL